MKLARKAPENRVNNKAIVVRLPEKDWDLIRTEAKSTHTSITEIARRYLKKGMEKEINIHK